MKRTGGGAQEEDGEGGVADLSERDRPHVTVGLVDLHHVVDHQHGREHPAVDERPPEVATKCQRADETCATADRPDGDPELRHEADVHGPAENRERVAREIAERSLQIRPDRDRAEQDERGADPPRRDHTACELRSASGREVAHALRLDGGRGSRPARSRLR